MGTRGTYGFRKNGRDKLTYNHWDSYPDNLGWKIAEFCRTHDVKKLNDICDKIVLVKETNKVAPEHEDYVKRFGQPDASEYYEAIRNMQGDMDVMDHIDKHSGIILMTDAERFICGSLWCEYGYIINLDENVLEFWKGFQEQPDPGNRYGQKALNGYYPCRMLCAFSLEDIWHSNADVVVEKMHDAVRKVLQEEESGGK